MTSLPHLNQHQHLQNQTQSAAERNRAYFSSPDQIYLREKPFFDVFAAKWTEEFLAHESWLDLIYETAVDPSEAPRKLKMLDYACGPGMAGFAALKLSPQVGNGEKGTFNPVVGVDIADGMVGLFNERVVSLQSEIPAGTSIEAYRGDFVSPASAKTENATIDQPGASADSSNSTSSAPEVPAEDPERYFSDFDLITCIAAVHHFEDPVLAISRLTERLSKNGVLFICDMVPGEFEQAEDVWTGRSTTSDDGHGHSHGHSHGHNHNHKHGHGHGHGHSHGDAHGDGEGKDHVDKNISGGKGEDTGLVHHGFTKAYIEEVFSKAGLDNVKTRLMDLELVMPDSFGGQKRKMFWAIGKQV